MQDHGIQIWQLAEGFSLQSLKVCQHYSRYIGAETLVTGRKDEQMALCDPKSVRDAGIPKHLQHAVKGPITEWKIPDWGRSDLSELFGGSLTSASVLLE